MAFDPHTIIPILLICYIAWRLYARVRRHIGRQTLKTGKLTYLIGIYSAITVVVGVSAAMYNTTALAGLGGGFLLGAVLAFAGLRLTVFETTAEGQFYTPNTFIGVGLSALFIGRLLYRLFIIYSNQRQQLGTPVSPKIAQSPLTLLIFGLLFGYYVTYFAGVLVRAKREKRGLVATPAP